LRTSFQWDRGFRIGMGVGVYDLNGLDLIHGPLPSGVSASLTSSGLVGIEAFLGKAFDARALYPFIDLVNRFNIVAARVDVAIDGYGTVGSTELLAFSYTLAPRIGVFMPLDGDWYVEAAGQYGLFGLERGGGYVAFGTWDNY